MTVFVEPLLKQKKKKSKSWLKASDPPEWVRRQVRERSNGLCEYSRPKFKYEKANHMHHIKNKALGGGSGMNLAINLWHINFKYHDHNNEDFLKAGEEELKRRINKLFIKKKYTFREIAALLQVPKDKQDDLWNEVHKGFLKHDGEGFYIWDIKRWLMKNNLRRQG